MESPIHPDFKPAGPTPTNPFSIRDDPLIQGYDIELVPSTRPLSNSAPEVIPYSTLEVAVDKPPPPGQPHPYLLPTYLDPHAKAWESHSNGSLYSHSASALTSAAPLAAPGHRYTNSDSSSPFEAPPPADGGGRGKRERICGVRRQIFCIGLAVGVFLVVVAVAVGVGVGVGLSKPGNGESTSTPTPSSTRTLPVPIATSTPSSFIACPGNNLTLYSASQHPQKKYLLLCGLDYNSNLGTTLDMYNAPTDTLAECVDLCARQEGCVGAGWGRGATGDGAAAICWLKSQLGGANDAPAWSFVVQDEGT
ncbi:hypothetical protein C8A00DRAFT_37662 [Chaetomidium leptoderma]|uniref:Apple domain-containing protein n=1 Tax=Chaetomidium leptoderma TaxID=669021 RepID=A0AAN6VE18_9PEZI|nr:hypothetical protein C8A00DRAFT_37662 [Chaetomidium leptoderma]